MVGVDTWMFGTTNRAATGPNITPTLQLMLVRNGIRVGEGFQLDDLAAAGVDRFVFVHNPQRALGATASNAPATAIANVDPDNVVSSAELDGSTTHRGA